MRALVFPLLLLVAGCGRGDAPANEIDNAARTEGAAAEEIIVYASGPRDRLCLSARAGGVAGVIAFAPTDDSNCSIRGTWSDGASAALRPQGDEKCVIPLEREGDIVTLGEGGPACAYYCGPSATLAGKTFVRMDNPAPVTDIAGDPLC